MTDEFEYHRNKKPDKTYVSKRLSLETYPNRKFRIASKVFDTAESHSFALEHGEVVIRVTGGGRQEIIAKFYEDTRGVFGLTIQRFSTTTGTPHKQSFSFSAEEVARLLTFIGNLRHVPLAGESRLNITDHGCPAISRTELTG